MRNHKTVNRKWMTLIRDAKQLPLSKFLLDLKAIKQKTFVNFLNDTNEAYKAWRNEKESNRRRNEIHKSNIYGHAPKNIKPTKQRRW